MRKSRTNSLSLSLSLPLSLSLSLSLLSLSFSEEEGIHNIEQISQSFWHTPYLDRSGGDTTYTGCSIIFKILQPLPSQHCTGPLLVIQKIASQYECTLALRHWKISFSYNYMIGKITHFTLTYSVEQYS